MKEAEGNFLAIDAPIQPFSHRVPESAGHVPARRGKKLGGNAELALYGLAILMVLVVGFYAINHFQNAQRVCTYWQGPMAAGQEITVYTRNGTVLGVTCPGAFIRTINRSDMWTLNTTSTQPMTNSRLVVEDIYIKDKK